MHRYTIDNAVMYSQDDLALFRESPFATWMERLTLENPDHGILPDRDAIWPPHTQSPHANIAETLRAEGRRVIEIDCDTDETERRTATIAAMKAGADFIVDGQLSADNFSDRIDLLMRTSGYSQLGDFLYIPCETRAGEMFRLTYRLAFFAELLHLMQGQLPPQMLIIQNNADVLSLQTEDHIHYYRAVSSRFVAAMAAFRKHRMPNPTESCHFGRWAECASEVLRQRAGRDDSLPEEAAEETIQSEALEMQLMQVAAGAEQVFDSSALVSKANPNPNPNPNPTGRDAQPAYTLVEQARQLDPEHFKPGMAPGRAPNLAAFPLKSRVEEQEHAQPAPTPPDAALENLEFIGRDGTRREIARTADPVKPSEPTVDSGLRDPLTHLKIDQVDEVQFDAIPPDNLGDLSPLTAVHSEDDFSLPEGASEEPFFLPPDTVPAEELGVAVQGREPSPTPRSAFASHSMVDSDSAPSSALAPTRPSSEQVSRPNSSGDPEQQHLSTSNRRSEPGRAAESASQSRADEPAFDSRLKTGEDFD